VAQDKRRLRSRITGAPVDASGHRRFSAELRADIVEHARERIADGASQKSVADELGIAARLLWTWLHRDVVVREVVIEEQPTPRRADRRLVLRSGIEIVGLDLDELIAIARALS